jgi:hypothetical protein
MTKFDVELGDDEGADQPPARTAAGGEFFVVDRWTFMAACALGLNPTIAYITIARGAGSRPTSGMVGRCN